MRWGGRVAVVALLVAGWLLLPLPAPAGAQGVPPPTAAPSPPPTDAEPPASVTVPDVPAEANPEDAADPLPPSPPPSAPPSPGGGAPGRAGDAAVEGTAGVPGPRDADAAVAAADHGDPARLDEVLRSIEDHERASGRGLVDELLGDGGSPVPTGHYQVGTDIGFLDHGERVLLPIMSMVHQLGVWTVAAMTWVLGFVLRFELGHLLAGESGTVAQGYADALRTGGLQVIGRTALLIAVAHAGWKAMRDRGASAAADVIAAGLIALVGAFLMANADRAGCTGLQVMSATTIAMIELSEPDGAEEPAPYEFCDGGSGAADPARGPVALPAVHQTFLHEPYLLLQYGQVPEPGTPCRAVADALVAVQPWGDDDFPRDRLRDAGCPVMVAFNEDLGADRVVAAVVWTVATAAFAVAVVLTAGTLLVAQVAGAVLVIAMPLAVAVGVSPGAGRQVLVRWVHGVMKVGVMFLGSGFFLALLMTAVDAVQRTAQASDLPVRMLSSVVVAWALVILRGKVFGSMRQAAATTAQGLAPGMDVGGPGRGPGAWAAGTAVDAAYTSLVLHQGAEGVAAGAAGAARARRGVASASARAGAGAAAAGGRAAQGIAALGRAARLRRGGGGP